MVMMSNLTICCVSTPFSETMWWSICSCSFSCWWARCVCSDDACAWSFICLISFRKPFLSYMGGYDHDPPQSPTCFSFCSISPSSAISFLERFFLAPGLTIWWARPIG